MKQKRKFKICDEAGCKEFARHQVMHGEVDTGIALCCKHMDNMMQQLSTRVPMLEGAVGLLKWKKEHAQTCPDYQSGK